MFLIIVLVVSVLGANNIGGGPILDRLEDASTITYSGRDQDIDDELKYFKVFSSNDIEPRPERQTSVNREEYNKRAFNILSTLNKYYNGVPKNLLTQLKRHDKKLYEAVIQELAEQYGIDYNKQGNSYNEEVLKEIEKKASSLLYTPTDTSFSANSSVGPSSIISFPLFSEGDSFDLSSAASVPLSAPIFSNSFDLPPGPKPIVL